MKFGMKINFGIVRIAVVRSIFMFSLMTFLMVLVDFVKTHGFQWWYCTLPFLLFAWYLFDMNVIWKQEINATFQYSDDFKEQKVLLTQILSELKRR